ncbi:hypothetical protein AMAG_02890 [Allomyces macrogynus ATCC 38327]|uniref:Uncharacterized protein n=1 Tax=Allomyces macrogynus (strain ATCC 38327) TaxID=578462 RepID=A0A0L0S417_ALLM3|nr:hypothetical protein AMAG_02890 [Allomyces macrogynus ATCC 38327]|eukprot:KNE57141.1 hypothetical protein AMAG_02890 [Allomyces macrogynus ATCC 38327]
MMASSGNAPSRGGRRLYVGRKTGETMPADLQFEDDGTIAPEAFFNAFAEQDRRATTFSVASNGTDLDAEFEFDDDHDESLFHDFVDYENGHRRASAIDLGADGDAPKSEHEPSPSTPSRANGNGTHRSPRRAAAAAPPPAPPTSRRHTLSTAAFKTASPLRAPPLTVASTPSPPPHRASMSSPIQAATTVTKDPFLPKRVLPRTPPWPASAPAPPATKTPPHRITDRMIVPSSSPRPRHKNGTAAVAAVELSQSQDLDLAHLRLDDDDHDDEVDHDDDDDDDNDNEMQVDHDDSHAAEPNRPPTPPSGPASRSVRKSTSEARYQYSRVLDATPPPPAPRLGSPAVPAARVSRLPNMDDEFGHQDEATQTMRGAARTMSPTVHPASLTLSQGDAPPPPVGGVSVIFDRALKPRPKASRPSQAAGALFATPAAKGKTTTLNAPARGPSVVDRLANSFTPGSDAGTPFDRDDLRRKRERARELLELRRMSTPSSQGTPIATAPSNLAGIQGPLARTTASLKLQLSQLAAEATAPVEPDRPSSPPPPPLQASQPTAARRKLVPPVIPKPVLSSQSNKALLAVRASTRARPAAPASVASAPAAVYTKDTARARGEEVPAVAPHADDDGSDTDNGPGDHDDNEPVSESESVELVTPDHRPMSAALDGPGSPLDAAARASPSASPARSHEEPVRSPASEANKTPRRVSSDSRFADVTEVASSPPASERNPDDVYADADEEEYGVGNSQHSQQPLLEDVVPAPLAPEPLMSSPPAPSPPAPPAPAPAPAPSRRQKKKASPPRTSVSGRLGAAAAAAAAAEVPPVNGATPRRSPRLLQRASTPPSVPLATDRRRTTARAVRPPPTATTHALAMAAIPSPPRVPTPAADNDDDSDDDNNNGENGFAVASPPRAPSRRKNVPPALGMTALRAVPGRTPSGGVAKRTKATAVVPATASVASRGRGIARTAAQIANAPPVDPPSPAFSVPLATPRAAGANEDAEMADWW